MPQPQQQQPYMRDNGGRDHQRDHQPALSARPAAARAPRIASIVRSRNISRNRSRSRRADNGSVDRLPSFITGPQPQINGGAGGYEGNGGGERFPRRRRRPHGGPRPEGMAQPAAAAPCEDFNPGNE